MLRADIRARWECQNRKRLQEAVRASKAYAAN